MNFISFVDVVIHTGKAWSLRKRQDCQCGTRSQMTSFYTSSHFYHHSRWSGCQKLAGKVFFFFHHIESKFGVRY